MPTDGLIQRIESAEGPSRELDAEIARQLSGNPKTHWYTRFDGIHAKDETAPAFSSSIDAALQLVPEDMRDEIEISTLYCVARVGINLNHAPDDGPYYGESPVNSIPLAICSAAIKAREAGQ